MDRADAFLQCKRLGLTDEQAMRITDDPDKFKFFILSCKSIAEHWEESPCERGSIYDNEESLEYFDRFIAGDR